jgi:hypothetical protein
MDYFTASRLKINRANKHIEDLKAAVDSIPGRYASTIESDAKTGGQTIKYFFPEQDIFLSDLALVIGDALHNLRAALDYAWVGTIERFFPGTVDPYTKFPIRETEQDIKGALNSRRIETNVPNLFKRVVSDIKPYRGGNDAIYRLHHLDIRDKHALLIPVVNAISIVGIIAEDECGKEVPSFPTFTITGRNPLFIDLPLNWRLKDKGKPTTAVLFENGLAMQYTDVGDMLSSFAVFTLKAVDDLQYI